MGQVIETIEEEGGGGGGEEEKEEEGLVLMGNGRWRKVTGSNEVAE